MPFKDTVKVGLLVFPRSATATAQCSPRRRGHDSSPRSKFEFPTSQALWAACSPGIAQNALGRSMGKVQQSDVAAKVAGQGRLNEDRQDVEDPR